MLGLGQCLGGCPAVDVEVEPIHDAATTAGAVGLFVLLKAFSSGATALTGVEAISNGVPAFQRPQAHNAATTLAIMGGDRDHDVPRHLLARDPRRGRHRERGAIGPRRRSRSRSSGTGSIGFYVVQVFTAAILILAANTAYQDFPRLASILARDRYLPSQFVNRGDRLVFSNGVIGARACSRR